MTSFGKKLYRLADRLPEIYDKYGMSSEFLLVEYEIIELINQYTKIELNLREWDETRSIETASKVCEDLCR